jgi:hypothetical protein
MNNNDNSNDPERPNRIAKKASEIAHYFHERQQFYAKKAQEYGYSEELFKNISSTMTSTQDNPLYSGLETSLNKFDIFVKAREKQAEKFLFDVSSASYALATSVSSTTSTVTLAANSNMSLADSFDIPKPPISWTSDRIELYAARLEKLEPELGRLSRSVWQSYYGGAENAERAALLSMRQLYDHLFQILAPDDEIRGTKYFKEKDGDKKYQIHRIERINYVANTKISDSKLAETLIEQASHLLKLYDQLNKLHTRGKLNRENVKVTLTSMQSTLEEWIDALNM